MEVPLEQSTTAIDIQKETETNDEKDTNKSPSINSVDNIEEKDIKTVEESEKLQSKKISLPPSLFGDDGDLFSSMPNNSDSKSTDETEKVDSPKSSVTKSLFGDEEENTLFKPLNPKIDRNIG